MCFISDFKVAFDLVKVRQMVVEVGVEMGRSRGRGTDISRDGSKNKGIETEVEPMSLSVIYVLFKLLIRKV